MTGSGSGHVCEGEMRPLLGKDTIPRGLELGCREQQWQCRVRKGTPEAGLSPNGRVLFQFNTCSSLGGREWLGQSQEDLRGELSVESTALGGTETRRRKCSVELGLMFWRSLQATRVRDSSQGGAGE